MTNETCCATNSVAANLTGVLENQFEEGQQVVSAVQTWLIENGIEFAINVLVAILILIVGGFAVSLITKAVRKALKKTNRISDLLETFICSVVSKAGWAVIITIFLQRLGVDVGPLIAGLGVTGFILGFAFQESLGNLASGIMIALNQPFKIGDYIIASGIEGSVLELNMMATVMATADNKRVTVPNKSVWGGPITNFSALGKRRVDLVAGIDYGADVGKAKEIALAALKSVPGVLDEPAPIVEVSSLGDSAVVLAVRPWCKCADYWDVYFAGYKAVKEAFDKNGIAIPFPQLTVHLDK